RIPGLMRCHLDPKNDSQSIEIGAEIARVQIAPIHSTPKPLHPPAARLILNTMTPPHLPPATTRRDFLFRAGGGLGGIALAHLLARDARADQPSHAHRANGN